MPPVKGVVRGELFEGSVSEKMLDSPSDTKITRLGYWNLKGCNTLLII